MNPEKQLEISNILIVDDDKDVLLSAELVLKAPTRNIQCLLNPSDMQEKLETTQFQVVLLDMNFTRGYTSGNEGFYWLKKIREVSPLTRIVMATAYSDIDLAIEAIKQGASDFLVKPWENEKLIAMIENSVISSLADRGNKSSSDQAESNESMEFNIARLEKQTIKQAIEEYEGNLSKVAKALGMGRTTLYRKMEKYELAV